MTKHIAVTANTPSRHAEAKQLAEQLDLPLCDPASKDYDYLLIFTPDYLGLQKTTDKSPPFFIDFIGGKMGHRRQQALSSKELLSKAVGLKPQTKPMIIDATAGLGRDSFILATRGYHLTLLERSPIVHALLQDALLRAHYHASTASIAARLHLINANALTWLNCHDKPDVIYLDPMFPERRKSASVKKEMLILQELLGKETDATPLFELALTCAAHRVVVKRPRLAPFMTERKPSFSLEGKSSRFDIYLAI